MKIAFRLLPLAFFAPLFALAQLTGGEDAGGVSTFFEGVLAFMNDTLVPLVFALAFLMFLWGMFKTFILGGGDEEKQSEGKQLMMYSIAGFVVMVSLWGIVNLVADGFGFSGEDSIVIPDLPER